MPCASKDARTDVPIKCSGAIGIPDGLMLFVVPSCGCVDVGQQQSVDVLVEECRLAVRMADHPRGLRTQTATAPPNAILRDHTSPPLSIPERHLVFDIPLIVDVVK